MRGGNLLVARTCEDHDGLTISAPSPPMVTRGYEGLMSAQVHRVITLVQVVTEDNFMTAAGVTR